MYINSIFRTIQGEGPFTGKPHVFIRTQGCSVLCSFCDAKNTWKKLENKMTIDEILAKVDTLKTPNIKHLLITGGEPLEQEDFNELVQKIFDKYPDITISLETSGYLPINTVDGRVYVFMDIKLPSAKAKQQTPVSNFFNTSRNLIKMVVSDNTDWAVAKKIIHENPLISFIISPTMWDKYLVASRLVVGGIKEDVAKLAGAHINMSRELLSEIIEFTYSYSNVELRVQEHKILDID